MAPTTITSQVRSRAKQVAGAAAREASARGWKAPAALLDNLTGASVPRTDTTRLRR